MAESYELFRLSLIESDQSELFSTRETREEYIRRIFGREWKFTHYKIRFHYLPASSVGQMTLGRYMLGHIGREIATIENLPPDEGFAEQIHEGWRACVVAIDPTDAGDGQKLALELNLQIATPLPLMRSLVKLINAENGERPYRIEIQPIFDAASFWSFAAINRGDIVRLSFDFVVPNGLWSAKTSLRDELKAAHDTMKAQEVSTTLKSHAGLNTDADPVKEAVEYAEKGSGSIKAKTRTGKVFSSTNKRKRTTIIFDAVGKTRSKLARAAMSLAKILDNE